MTDCPLNKCPLLIGCPLRRECGDSRQKYLAGECSLPCMKPEQPEPDYGAFTDPRDGRVYKTVKIGDQVWLAENLNFDYAGSKCYNSDPANRERYGLLYDWETAKKACPPGWHLPTNAEWDALLRFVDGTSGTESPYDSKTAGKRLKAKSGWKSDGNGEDTYGFAALPGGNGNSGGYFYDVGDNGYWWSASEGGASGAYGRYMYYYYEYALWGSRYKSYLFSVRCLQDCGGTQ